MHAYYAYIHVLASTCHVFYLEVLFVLSLESNVTWCDIAYSLHVVTKTPYGVIIVNVWLLESEDV